jgi:pimeloyl-ACP methyl ester carboxylesterase
MWRRCRDDVVKEAPIASTPSTVALPPGFAHGRAELADVSMHYVAGGQGPAIVLLHGWPQTWYCWRKVMPLLAQRGYRVIAPDHRGLGDSSRPGDGYDRRTMASDLHELLQNLELASVSVVGHDWGASVAYAFAAMHPDQVNHLAMVEGFPLGPWVTEEPAWSAAPASAEGWFSAFHQIPELPELLVTGHEREYLSYFYRQSAADATSITDVDITEYVRTYAQPGAMKASFALYRAIATDIADNLRFACTPLRMPVLALGGDLNFNEVIINSMRHLASDVTGGVLVGAKHWIPEEQAGELVHHLLALLDRGRTQERPAS